MNEVLNEMLDRFQVITTKEGRKMVQELGMIILQNMDFLDVVGFDSIMQSLETHRPRIKQGEKLMKGLYFSKDFSTLSIWVFYPSSVKIGVVGKDTSVWGSVFL